MVLYFYPINVQARLSGHTSHTWVGIEVLSICITTCLFQRLSVFKWRASIQKILYVCSRIDKLERSYNIFNYVPVLAN